MKELLQEYAALKTEEKRIADAIKIIQPQIIALVDETIRSKGEKEGTIATEYGNFTLSQLRKYSYPLYVTDAEAKLDQLKTDSEAKGDGTYAEKPSVKFTQLKANKNE